MHAPKVTRVTEAEFLALPETMDRVELVDGEVVVAPSPTGAHQDLVGAFYAALRAWSLASETEAWVGLSPLDVRLEPGRVLQPDVFVLLGRSRRPEETPIDAEPDLCVEVLLSNRVYDRVTKRLLYAQAGVAEYWVVEPGGQVERWFGDELGRSEIVEERLTSPLLPGFELDLAKVV